MNINNYIPKVQIGAFFTTVFFCIFLLSFHQLSDHDLGFLLKGGQWIYEHKAVPNLDTYTYTVNKHAYIDSHWLFQLVIFILYKIGGVNLLNLFVSLIITSTFALLYSIGKQNTTKLLLLLAAAICIQFRFHLRPEIISWLCLAWQLKILHNYVQKPSTKIFLLLLVQLIWTNCHGLSIIGVFITFIFVATNFYKTKKINKTLLLVLLLQTAMLLANPYFIEGALFPFYLYTRLKESNIMNNEISEFKSVFEIQKTTFNPFIDYFILVGLVFFIIFFTIHLIKRKLSIFEIIVALVLLYLSTKAIRNIPLFILFTIPLLTLKVELLENKWIKGGMILGIIIFAIQIINGNFYHLKRQEQSASFGINKNAYPIEIGNFIIQNNINENLLNDFNTGSWLEWQTGNKVYIDGRLEVMREDHFKNYLNSFKKDSLQKLIKKYNNKVIIFDILSSGNWHRQLMQNDSWRLVKTDGQYAMFLRKDYLPNIPAFNFNLYLVQNKLTKQNTDSLYKVWIKNYKKPTSKWLQALVKPISYPYYSLFVPAIWSYRNNQIATAEKLYLAFLAETEGNYPEIYTNLGALYFHSKQYEKALDCYLISQIYFNSEYIKDRISIIVSKLPTKLKPDL